MEFPPQHRSPSLVDPQAELGMLNLQVSFRYYMISRGTLPETNIFASQNGWLEDSFHFGARPTFRCYVSFREGISFYFHMSNASRACHIFHLKETKGIKQKRFQSSPTLAPYITPHQQTRFPKEMCKISEGLH